MTGKTITTEQMQAIYDAAIQGGTFRFGLTEPSVELMGLLHKHGGIGIVIQTLIEMIRARELLANREAQPVIVVGDDGGDALAYRRLIQSFAPGTKLYAATPAPELTDEAIDRIVVPLSPDGLDEEKHHCEWHLYHDRERIRKELREYFAAPRSPEELDKYTQGVKDGLEWAARTVEANHPNTGDWLYDDRDDLAKAIRKGPDMLAAAPEGGK